MGEITNSETRIKHSVDNTAFSARTVSALSEREGKRVADAPEADIPSLVELSDIYVDRQGVYCDLRMDSPSDHEPSWPDQVGTVVAVVADVLNENDELDGVADRAKVEVQYRKNATALNVRIDFPAQDQP